MSDRQADFFAVLRDSCHDEWDEYTHHPFILGLEDGTLSPGAFRYYLVQDYLFLIQFARAYGLAAYKSKELSEIRRAADGLRSIIDVEIELHVAYCGQLGISPSSLEKADQDLVTTAYTSYVADLGLSGDLLDLHVALAPCMIGYGVIGARLGKMEPRTLCKNPYAKWIGMYAGDAYQSVAKDERTFLNDLALNRGGYERLKSLSESFRKATRLETAFWQMALNSDSSY